MRSYTRHQLKQDSFRTQTTETISWAVEHRSKLTAAVVAVVVVLALLLGGWAFINYRDQQARSELAGAIQKYNAPIRPAGTPATPDMLSYGSIQERAKAANGDFTHIADKYTFTQSARRSPLLRRRNPARHGRQCRRGEGSAGGCRRPL